jgi:hypothetical protein
MEVNSLAETLISLYQTTRRNVPEFHTINTYTVGTSKFHTDGNVAIYSVLSSEKCHCATWYLLTLR